MQRLQALHTCMIVAKCDGGGIGMMALHTIHICTLIAFFLYLLTDQLYHQN